MTEVFQGSGFRRAYKRLHPNQKADVDDAVAEIVADPTLGEAKKGDLAGVFVYKFQCLGNSSRSPTSMILLPDGYYWLAPMRTSTGN